VAGPGSGQQRSRSSRSRRPGRLSGRLGVVAVSLALAAMALVPAGGPASAGQGRPAAGTAGTTVGHGTDQAVISRDSYGVPTITAKSRAGMWFGAGWAQAQDRLVQLELTKRAVEGTLSQILGSAELSQDETVRTLFYTPAEVQAQYESLPASTRAALVAFSNGINAYEDQAYASAASEQASAA